MPETYKLKNSIVPCLVLLSLFLTMAPALAGDVRPGEINPVMDPNRWTLFRDDEVVSFIENRSAGNDDLYSYAETPSSDDLEHWNTEHVTETTGHIVHGVDYSRFSIATGRVTVLDTDQMVRAYMGPNATAFVEVLDDYHHVEMTKTFTDNGDDSWYRRVRVVVGDLDLEIDDDGNYHDEIIVARLYKQDDKYYMALTVLDYNLNELASNTVGHHKEVVDIRLEIGDFDGDDLLEMAIINNYNDNDFSVEGLWYDTEEKVVNRATQFSLSAEGDYYGADTAAGDFDGDGKEEVVLYNYHLYFLKADKDMLFSMVHKTDVVASDQQGKIVPGLFYIDTNNGYGITRRQLAIVAGDQLEDEMKTGLTVHWYRIGENLHATYMGSGRVTEANHQYTGFDLAAGNFIGHLNDNTLPVMQLALSYAEIIPPVDGPVPGLGSPAKKVSKVSVFKIQDNELVNVHTLNGVSFETENPAPENWLAKLPNLSTTLAALDLDGDTYRLGAPVRISVENFLSLSAILQEPPKHVDYLPQDPGNWDGPWQMINVSAYPYHHVAFENKEETEMESKSITTTDHAYGESLAVSAQQSTKTTAGIMDGALTYSEKVKIGFDYEKHKEKYESEYHSESISISAETDEDDILYGSYQDIDIWRYPVFGVKTDDNLNIFQDIIMPGARHNFSGGGLQHMDWYTPVHQNRNLLSYPDMEINFPPDVGEFTVLGETKKEVMIPDIEFDYDGNRHELNIDWTDSAGSGEEKEYKTTLKVSVDLSMAYKGSVGVPAISKTESKWKVAVNFYDNHSWSDKEISSETISSGKAVRVVIPDIQLPNKGWGYVYTPAVYVSDGGTLKCAHGVDIQNLVDNGSRWANYYGGRPDPGLSLPERFEYDRSDVNDFGIWHLVEDESRMIMRGLFMYQEENDPVTDEPQLYAESPTDGDQVRLKARVYNFCLNQTVVNLPVRFEYALIDSATHMEFTDAERGLIGETTIGELGPLAMKEAEVIWDTTGLGTIENPETGEIDPNIALRIYVVLDPDDEINDEIHEWKDLNRKDEDGWTDADGRLYHGNNEGFYPDSGGIFIHPNADDGLQAVTSQYEASRLNLHGTTLGIEVPGKGILTQGDITVTQGKTYKLRAHIVADNTDPAHHPLLFHDRHPDDTDEVIDMAIVRGTRPDTYVWGRWTPNESGEYDLWTVLLDRTSTEAGNQTSDSLHVTVVEEKKSDSDDDNCFISISKKNRTFDQFILIGFILFCTVLLAFCPRNSKKRK